MARAQGRREEKRKRGKKKYRAMLAFGRFKEEAERKRESLPFDDLARSSV